MQNCYPISGHCSDFDTRQPPRGLQFTLGTQRNPTMFDTIVMANLVRKIFGRFHMTSWQPFLRTKPLNIIQYCVLFLSLCDCLRRLFFPPFDQGNCWVFIFNSYVCLSVCCLGILSAQSLPGRLVA